jgi:hypothetical protein
MGRPRNVEPQALKVALETFRVEPVDLISTLWKPRNTETMISKKLPALNNIRHNRTSSTTTGFNPASS